MAAELFDQYQLMQWPMIQRDGRAKEEEKKSRNTEKEERRLRTLLAQLAVANTFCKPTIVAGVP